MIMLDATYPALMAIVEMLYMVSRLSPMMSIIRMAIMIMNEVYLCCRVRDSGPFEGLLRPTPQVPRPSGPGHRPPPGLLSAIAGLRGHHWGQYGCRRLWGHRRYQSRP